MNYNTYNKFSDDNKFCNELGDYYNNVNTNNPYKRRKIS